ncbi:MAG: MarR family transcriptional regulator [Nanoarchaeota archaeon]|nr:MarR family transcriptional regulator [Nanoarchaeota archaeon]
MKILYFFLFFVCISQVSAQPYYAQLEIYVDSDGLTTIIGDTNLDNFTNITNSDLFTKKEGSIWTFYLSSEDIELDFYSIKVFFPDNFKLLDISTDAQEHLISSDIAYLSTLHIGENEVVDIEIDYEINREEFSLTPFMVILNSFFGIILLVILFGFLYKKYSRKKIIIIDEKEKVEFKEEEEVIVNSFDISIFPKRQRKILEILLIEKRITQKDLEKKLKIPKSSLSRNLRRLEIKKLIRKESLGITNYIELIEDDNSNKD